MRGRYLVLLAVIASLLLGSLACGAIGISTNGEIHQWASSASASSSFGASSWSAEQAIGEPDTDACGDYGTAWASMNSDGEDWLDVGFATPVVPTQINIYETYNPGSIIKVEVRDTDGGFHTVWQGTPKRVNQCPRIFTIDISNIDFQVTAVLISLDQSVIGNWDEIDAVELVGRP